MDPRDLDNDPIKGKEPLVLSVAELLDIYLFGVNLTDDFKRSFSTEMFEFYIRAAQESIRKHIGVSLIPRKVVNERHDYRWRDFQQFAWLHLMERRIIDVTRCVLEYPPGSPIIEFQKEWLTWSRDGNRLQIIPGFGPMSSVVLGSGGIAFQTMGVQIGYIPDAFRVDYEAGFLPGECPEDIRHCVGMLASYGPLNIAGDLLAGAGIATKSISIPGLSQSIGTTSSATNSGYGSRILEYQKELKSLLPVIKEAYGQTTKLIVI